VIWIDGIGYVVSPLDGINGARPAFIVPEKRSTVAAAEQMASQPKAAKLNNSADLASPAGYALRTGKPVISNHLHPAAIDNLQLPMAKGH